MEQEREQAQAPDLSNEEMKMPETTNRNATQSTPATSPVNGVVIGLLVVLLLAILAGMYYWFSQLTTEVLPPEPIAVERPTAEENDEPESTTAEAAVETQAALSTSDEIAAIEADIAATDLESLDAELNAIDAEVEAALNE